MTDFAARGNVVVYRADQDTNGVFELFAYSPPWRAFEFHGPPPSVR